MADDTSPDIGLLPNHRPSIRVSKAAAILEVNISTIYRLIRSGALEAHRIGKRGVRIFADSLRHYQEQGKINCPGTEESKSVFQESKTLTSSNPSYRDAIEYLRSIGCLK